MLSSQRRRGAGLLAVLAFAGSALLVGVVGPVMAADPVVLTVGGTQDLDASNPFNTELVVGYEAFQLTYNLQNLVGDGCTETYQGGLTYFGRELVSRLNEYQPRPEGFGSALLPCGAPVDHIAAAGDKYQRSSGREDPDPEVHGSTCCHGHASALVRRGLMSPPDRLRFPRLARRVEQLGQRGLEVVGHVPQIGQQLRARHDPDIEFSGQRHHGDVEP